jgi:osmotically-inducible protein OsmY
MALVTSPMTKLESTSGAPITIGTAEERIRCVLRQSSYGEIRNVSCTFHKGVAILHGRVGSFYIKQVAQTILAKVDDVKEIVNRLQVVYPRK